MKIFFLIYFVIVLLTISILGFRGSITEKEPVEVFNDMDRQAKYKPQSENDFFANKQNDRLPPTRSVPRGNLLDIKQVFDSNYSAKTKEELSFMHGKNIDGSFSDTFPYEASYDLIQLGIEKYNIFCVSCHGASGDGNGVTKEYGILAASYHDDRLRNETDGYIYDVISNGKGLMYGLKDRLSNREIWGIILYFRALQKSQYASLEDLSESEILELGININE